MYPPSSALLPLLASSSLGAHMPHMHAHVTQTNSTAGNPKMMIGASIVVIQLIGSKPRPGVWPTCTRPTCLLVHNRAPFSHLCCLAVPAAKGMSKLVTNQILPVRHFASRECRWWPCPISVVKINDGVRRRQTLTHTETVKRRRWERPG